MHMMEGMGIDTGVDLDKLVECVWMAEEILGRQLWGHVSRAGARPTTKDRLFDINAPFVETLEQAGESLGLTIEWSGEGVAEKGTDTTTGRVVVKVDPRYFRPTEVETLLGDPAKARAELGWSAATSFEQLVDEMIDSDLELAKRDALVAREGFKVYQRHE